MADNALQELIDAAHGVLRYLKASTDPYERQETDALLEHLKRSAGDRLRKEVEEADKKDTAIIRFREAIVNFAAGYGMGS